MLTIPLASDHAGFSYKSSLIRYVTEKKYTIKDFGTFDASSCDYPDFAHKLARAVNEGHFQKGILLCGSGNGVAMVANKYPSVRAALCWSEEIAGLARRHNDANILCLPTRFISIATMYLITDVFLNTDFEGGRHQQRVNKI